MRQLNPLKAISHALKSVFLYRLAAVRLGMFWIPLLLVLGLAEQAFRKPGGGPSQFGMGEAIGLLSAVAGLIGFCAMAVAWHRFILRDEVAAPLQIGSATWRYLGNSLLIMLAMAVPLAAVAVLLAFLPPIVSVLIIPVAILAGAAAMRLSIKLPAVALGRTDFTFRDAWAASDGNFWQIVGVFALNAIIVVGLALAVLAIVQGVNLVLPAAAPYVALLIGAAGQLFYTVFNASIFTSLYGFFVEKRNY